MPLLAGYLSIILLSAFGVTAVISAQIMNVRIQAIADAAVLAGHEAAQQRGFPNKNSLEDEVKNFLAKAPSVNRIQIASIATSTNGAVSKVTICAKWLEPFELLDRKLAIICRSAEAKSFLVF